jgi:hypothetical protein
MDTLPDSRSVTHLGKLYCHLCLEVQQLVADTLLTNGNDNHATSNVMPIIVAIVITIAIVKISLYYVWLYIYIYIYYL